MHDLTWPCAHHHWPCCRAHCAVWKWKVHLSSRQNLPARNSQSGRDLSRTTSVVTVTPPDVTGPLLCPIAPFLLHTERLGAPTRVARLASCHAHSTPGLCFRLAAPFALRRAIDLQQASPRAIAAQEDSSSRTRSTMARACSAQHCQEATSYRRQLLRPGQARQAEQAFQ